MKWLIYKHTNKINKKVYVGQTSKEATERWRKDGSGYLSNPNTRFAKAILKYGWDGFNHDVIEQNIKSQEEANNREIYWISFYNSYDFDYGYNMTIGGDFSSPEVIEKARQTFKARKRSETKPIVCYELKKYFQIQLLPLNGF